MPEGIHTSAIAIQSNDPNTPILHVPAMMVVGAISGDITCDTDHLIAAIHVANANGVPDTLNLEEGCTYSLTEVNNDSDGPTGLPAITSEITINGNGATIKRETWDMPDFRLFYLADTGNLTLHRLRVTGGRVRGNGGAIRNNGGTVILADSEIRENNAGSDGGGIDNAGTLLVTNSTIVHNSANTSGDGLHNSGSSTVTLHNTILAYNDGQDCAGEAITSLGYNLDSDGTCGLAAVGDVTNTDPLLDYHASVPMSGSRAIDQGSCPGTPVDLRGSLRPVDVPDIANADDGCDMGAYENVDDLMTISPTDTTVELDLGAVAVKELAIHNNSPVPLDYTVHVPAPVGGIDLLLPLDESAGATSYLDLSGQARQASCTGISCPTAGVPGKVGTALLFDGVDDSVDTNLHVDQSRDPVTVMAWVRPDSTSAGRHMVFSTDDGGYDWSLLREGADWRVFTGENNRSTGLSVDVGQWQHVAVVFDGGWSNVRFYRNGVEVVIPYLDWDASSSDLAVGNRPVTRNRPFDGRIDEVHVYNRALSATEIQGSYDQSRDLAWLSYDPGAGTIPAYSTALVQVTFDASGVSAGAYGARIGIVGGAPADARFRVPARMVAGLAWNQVTCDAKHLIAALDIANLNDTADTLELAAGCVYTLTESDNDTDGPNGLPSISTEVAINGNGAIIERRLPGAEEWPIQDPFRIFHVAASGNLTLNQLTVRQGRGVIGADLPGGYGIANRGALILVDSTLSGNGDQEDSAGCGGGLYNFGGGNATLVNSRVTNNGVDRHSSGGGGICNDGTMTLTGSTVSGNGGGPNGGGILNRGTLSLDNSTLAGNSAFAFFGEWAGSGGGIENSGALTLRNSTVSGNSTFDSGGGIDNSGIVTLINSTISDNDVDESSSCSGICGGTANLRNTIVADQEFGVDCEATIVSLGYNLDSDGTCGLDQSTDLPNTAALLGPLQDNGGPTETHALQAGSPAIDQGSCPQTMADQRGEPRHVDAPGLDNADDACDVGAYERQAGTPLGVVTGTVTAAATGDPLAATLALLPTSQTAASDPESGVYSIWWATGTYTLQVSAPDYLTQTASVELDALVASRQDFVLELEQVQLFLPIVFR